MTETSEDMNHGLQVFAFLVILCKLCIEFLVLFDKLLLNGKH